MLACALLHDCVIYAPRREGQLLTTSLDLARPQPGSTQDAIDPLERFTRALPYRVRCSNDLSAGFDWTWRGYAVQREIAPDPPGWRTSLRFDMDCPCDGRPHKDAYCPKAATFWQEAGLPQPSLVIVRPENGHSHYVYLLGSWLRVDGADPQDLGAVRYYAAIERAYTRVLRADPSYGGLFHHNPLATCYTTLVGPAEPYSLRELARHVKLESLPRRKEPEIRTDGRNVEVFDRLRYWAYANVSAARSGPQTAWYDRVAARAIELAGPVRESHPDPSHPFGDKETLGIAKSVAGWTWRRYTGGNLILAQARAAVRHARDRLRAEAARRAFGCAPREEYLAGVNQRRTAARKLRELGASVSEIAQRLSASVRSVYRWLALFAPVPSPSPLSELVPRRPREKPTIGTVVPSAYSDGASAPSLSAGNGGAIAAAIVSEYAAPARSAESQGAENEVDLLAYARVRLSRPP